MVKKIILLGLLSILVLGLLTYSLPVETYVSPTESNNSFKSQDWIYVNITASENLNQSFLEIGNSSGGITNLTMSNNSLTNWYLNVTSQTDGEYNYTVWMENSSSNWNQSNFIVITLDTVDPDVNLIYPTNNYYVINETEHETIQFNYTPTDTNLDVCVLWGNFSGTWAVNQTDTSPTSGSGNNFTYILLNDGEYIWNVYCNDSATNSVYNDTNYTLTVDTVYPSIIFGSGIEDDGTYFNRDWIFVNVTASDTNEVNITFYLYNSTGDEITTSTHTDGTRSHNFTSITDTNELYYYNVTIIDSVAYSNSTSTRNITLDTTDPVVVIHTITDSQISQSVLNVNGTCTDTNVDSAYTNQSEYNTTDTAGALFNFTNTGISLRTLRYDILVTCNDSAGNTGTASPYYYYIGSDHNILLSEDYTLARLFNTTQISVHTSFPIEINDTTRTTATNVNSINTTQDWTSLNINFTPITIGSDHNAFVYREASGEMKFIDDSVSCFSVGTNEIKCITTGINVDSSGSNEFVSYNNEITLSGPSDNLINTSTNDTQTFRFTMVNTYNDTLPCNLVVDDTIVYTNTSTPNNTAMIFYSNTSLTNTSHTWFIECGKHNTSVRTLWIDNIAPVVDNYGYENISNGALELTYIVRENDTDATCAFYVFNNNTKDEITGTWNQSSGVLRECIYNVTASDMTYEGYFIVGVNITDTMGNSLVGTNQTNFTNVKLYAGWTAVQIDRNVTMRNLSSMNDGITRVSWYNNTAKSYLTYVDGLSTNADVTLYDGDSAFVQVTSDTSLLRELTWDYGVKRNITLTKGWNQMSAWNYTTYINLEQACDEPIDNSSIIITHVAWWESVNQRYTPHTCDFAYNNETQVPLGQGYFVRTNGTTTMGRYR